MCTKKSQINTTFWDFHEFLRRSVEICFGTATSPNLTFLQLEAILGTKTK
jgi:hypothetical protein